MEETNLLTCYDSNNSSASPLQHPALNACPVGILVRLRSHRLVGTMFYSCYRSVQPVDCRQITVDRCPARPELLSSSPKVLRHSRPGCSQTAIWANQFRFFAKFHRFQTNRTTYELIKSLRIKLSKVFGLVFKFQTKPLNGRKEESVSFFQFLFEFFQSINKIWDSALEPAKQR